MHQRDRVPDRASAEAPPGCQGDVAAIWRTGAIPTILELVCVSMRMGFAVVAQVTEDRWVACSVRDGIHLGIRPGDELSVESTICASVRRHRRHFSVNDLTDHERPSPSLCGFESWISAPLVMADGTFFGTLCAIDPKPGMLGGPGDTGPTRSFKLLAELVGFHLDAAAERARSEATRSQAHETSRLREQSIAVLGHELRSPLASIAAGTRMLGQGRDDAAPITRQIDFSILRMSTLIGDVLDFAESSWSGGLSVQAGVDGALETTLLHAIQEQLLVHPGRAVETAFALSHQVRCDGARISQLLSNLLGNALTHGSSVGPVRVSGFTWDGMFELSVSNEGKPIPPATVDRLFLPFIRGSHRLGKRGIGLGLFIASEIARAHGGRLDVSSTAKETRFTFRMPVRMVAADDAVVH